MVLLTSPGGLPFLKGGSLPWKPPLRGRAAEIGHLVDSVGGATGKGFSRAVDHEMRRRLDLFFTGVERYRRHPYRRDLADPPVLWTEGGTRLLDFGGEGRPVLFVPSLVNRAYILDLSAKRSLLRWLATEGVRPLLVDWGMPGALERRYTLTDYVAGRLDRALDAALDAVGGPMATVGYCMGGMLATSLALRRRRDISALCLMATPWDFSGGEAGNAKAASALICPSLWPATARTCFSGPLPVWNG